MLQKVKPAVQLKDMSLFRQQCYIDGAWVDADGKATLPVYNPADGVQIGTVPAMGEAETRRAIETANAAWPGWRSKTAKERAAIMRKWFDLMMANQEDLAQMMTGARQAAQRVARRDRLRRLLHRMVRGGSEARVR